MHFAVDEGKGFQIPFVWGYDSCQIVIANTEPHAEGTFPFVMIAHLAAEVMQACVLNSPSNLGGDVKLGGRGQFEVLVAGTGMKTGNWDVAGEDRNGAAVAVERREMPHHVGASW